MSTPLKWVAIGLITLLGVTVAKEPIRVDNCAHNPIYCQIIRNNPSIDKDYALKLSNVIYHTAKLYNISPARYTAILAQESLYKLGAINTKSKDYGIAQINHRTIKAYGFNTIRLTNDVEYSVKAGAIVLADLKRSFAHKEKFYWSRYNSSNLNKREKYQKLVMRFM